MTNKLYIGNLPFRIEESNLEQAFGAHGTVKSVKIITDRDSGRSKGFGFVEMETADQAQACIDQLDGQEFDGRNIRVSAAKEREERDSRGGGGYRGGNRGGNRGGDRGGDRW